MSTVLDALIALEFDEAQPLPTWKPGDPLIMPGDEPTVYALTLTYEQMEGICVLGVCARCKADDYTYVDRDGLCGECRGTA